MEWPDLISIKNFSFWLSYGNRLGDQMSYLSWVKASALGRKSRMCFSKDAHNLKRVVYGFHKERSHDRIIWAPE